MTPHKIKLHNASTLLLTSILASDGWAASLQDIMHGGSLLAEVFGSFEAKRDQGNAIEKEWLWETQEWEMSEKQRDCCKRAITALTQNKKVPVGKPSFLLLGAFGLE